MPEGEGSPSVLPGSEPGGGPHGAPMPGTFPAGVTLPTSSSLSAAPGPATTAIITHSAADHAPTTPLVQLPPALPSMADLITTAMADLAHRLPPDCPVPPTVTSALVAAILATIRPFLVAPLPSPSTSPPSAPFGAAAAPGGGGGPTTLAGAPAPHVLRIPSTARPLAARPTWAAVTATAAAPPFAAAVAGSKRGRGNGSNTTIDHHHHNATTTPSTAHTNATCTDADGFTPVRRGRKKTKASATPPPPLPRATPQLLDMASRLPQEKRRQFILSTQAIYPRTAEGPASTPSDKTQDSFGVRRVYLAGVAHCPFGVLKDDWEDRGILFRKEILNLDWITQQRGPSSTLEVVLTAEAEERFLTGISNLACSVLPYSTVERRDSGQRFLDRVARISRTTKSARARDFYEAWKAERTGPTTNPPMPTHTTTTGTGTPPPDEWTNRRFRAKVAQVVRSHLSDRDAARRLVSLIMTRVRGPESRAELMAALDQDPMQARATLERFMESDDASQNYDDDGSDYEDAEAMEIEADEVDTSKLILPPPTAAYGGQ